VTRPVRWDAVVVGAGPAGCAAAGVLAERGRRVLLLERDRLPRRKVCGEFLSGRARPALDRLGVRAHVEAIARPMSAGAIHPPSGRAVRFELTAPALGISRFALDALLARRAAELGCEVRCGARVAELRWEDGDFRVSWVGASGAEGGEARAAFAVGAWGRWDALDRALERRFGRERSRYAGWSRDYAVERAPAQGPNPLAGSGAPAQEPNALPRSGAPAQDVRLYVFHGGYCGLSPIEGRRVHLAGVVSERLRRELGGGWEAVEAHARGTNPALDRDLGALGQGGDALGTGPVYFTRKPPTSDGVILAGDAAGVLDPFSGEGQASALFAGILAGETIARALDSGEAPERAAREYARAWRRQLARRFAWSAAFRGLVLRPRLAGAAAAVAGETLTALAVRKLAQP
jgi:menaquinone-9 beta-reductase